MSARRRIAPPPVPRAQRGCGQARPVGGRSPRWGRSRAPRTGETRWEGATDPHAALVPQDAACGVRGAPRATWAASERSAAARG
eukprot:6345656-Prymnesium_polylepis.1